MFVDTVLVFFFLIKNVDCLHLLVVIKGFIYSVMGCQL